MNANLSRIIGVELMCAAQGIEFRAPLQTSPGLLAVMQEIRAKVRALDEDRFLAADMDAAATLIASGKLVQTAGLSGFVIGEAS